MRALLITLVLAACAHAPKYGPDGCPLDMKPGDACVTLIPIRAKGAVAPTESRPSTYSLSNPIGLYPAPVP